MSFPLIFIGVLLIVVAVRDKTQDFEALIADDFFGNQNFIAWVIAVLMLAATGSFKEFRPIADGFLALIAVALLLSQRGFFSEFERQALNG